MLGMCSGKPPRFQKILGNFFFFKSLSVVIPFPKLGELTVAFKCWWEGRGRDWRGLSLICID